MLPAAARLLARHNRKGEQMRKSIALFLAVLLTAAVITGCGKDKEEEKKAAAPEAPSVAIVTIGTGDPAGSYHATGEAIAKIVNQKKSQYRIQCAVSSTEGSVYNIKAVLAGDLQLGLAQSDAQYDAVKGLAVWREAGPQAALRSVFSVDAESVTLVAAIDAGIGTILDLKGKRVNLGTPGSVSRKNAIDALSAVGIDYNIDLNAESINVSQAPGLLQEGRIDAFFFTASHPNSAIAEVTNGRRKVRFAAITGLDTLVEKYPYYVKSTIPIKDYPGVINGGEVETVDVKATVVTSAETPDDIIYAIAKEVFDNFDAFKASNPHFDRLTKESMLEGLTAEIHPGALRYYKEAGLK